MKQILSFLILLSICLVSCQEEDISVPKPRMYPKVILPTQGVYIEYNKEGCPFKFDYPAYATIKPSNAKSNFENKLNDCWFDIHYSNLKAILYCSYSDIHSPEEYRSMIDKNYLLVNKHNKRADFIDESLIIKNKKPFGVQFKIDGEVATPYQFLLTDTTSHIFRASLYFNAPINPDSIAPIYNYIQKDLDRMVGSFEWK